MTDRFRRIGLAAGAAIMALGMVSGVFAASLHQNTSEPQPPFSGRRGGPPMGMMGPGPLGLIGPVVERIGLTDAQRAQVKSIMDSHRTEFQTMGKEAGTARKALEQAILTDPVDDNAVQAASAGVAAIDAQMAVAAAHVRAEIFQVLTDDQKAQVKQLIAQREAMGGRGRGRGR